MLCHLVIGAVQVGLIAASAVHPSARIIGNDQPRNTLQKLESTDVTVNPTVQILIPGRIGKGVAGCAEDGNKQRSRIDLTGLLVVNRNLGSGPIDEEFFAGSVFLA
jgi:hypothetical protein